MDKEAIELLARRAGLDKALAQFPDDVAAAAAQADGVAARVETPSDPAAEPWPPMRVGGCPLSFPPRRSTADGAAAGGGQ
ncbi:MAG: hypothetical protein AB7H71_08115 [Alphaproteobacteria bacterium]